MGAISEAVMPWSVGIFYTGLVVLFGLGLKLGSAGIPKKTMYFADEPTNTWANGNVKLCR